MKTKIIHKQPNDVTTITGVQDLAKDEQNSNECAYLIKLGYISNIDIVY